VFYGICGEGLGHFSRAVFLIPRLLAKGYVVEIFTLGRIADLCEKRFPECNVHRIPGFFMQYRSNSLNVMRTIISNSNFFLKGAIAAFSVADIARKKFPVAVISDYEPIVAWTAFVSRIPLITLDHQQIFSECKVESVYTKRFNKFLVHFSNKMTYLKPKVRVISSFFSAQIIKKSRAAQVKIIAPVLRPEVVNIKPTTGDHVVVYQTSRSFDWLAKILEAIPGEKRVYGTGQKQSGHPERPFSEETFLHDLATCRFVIVNGGHTTISESLYYGKPVLCFPVRGQGEQEMNAHYVAKLDYGMNYQLETGEVPDFSEFFEKEDEIRRRISNISEKCGNKTLEEIVFKQIS